MSAAGQSGRGEADPVSRDGVKGVSPAVVSRLAFAELDAALGNRRRALRQSPSGRGLPIRWT